MVVIEIDCYLCSSV